TAPSQRRDTTMSISEAMTLTHGRHVLKIGGGYRYFANRVMNAGFARGVVVSNNIGEFTSDAESSIYQNNAFRFPSFDYQLRNDAYVGRFRSRAAEGFVQDTWRVRPNVTVNYGARFDYFSTPEDRDHQTWNYDAGANGLV